MSKTSKTSSPSKSPLKKIFKALLIIFVVLLVVAGGALAWLRTSSGAGFVYGQVVKILSDNGFQLKAERFDGPLPSRLVMENFSLADADGPLLQAEYAEVQIKPLALLKKLVHIPLVKISGVKLMRVPAGGQNQAESSGSFALPVDIKLDQLEVEPVQIEAGAFKALGVNTPKIALWSNGFALVESGQALAGLSLKAAGADEKVFLEAMVNLAPDGAQPEGGQKLDFELRFEDQPGGLVSQVMNDPAWPGLQLNINGHGPLKDWRGRLKLALGGP